MDNYYEPLFKLAKNNLKKIEFFVDELTYEIDNKSFDLTSNPKTKYDNFVGKGYIPQNILIKEMMDAKYTGFDRSAMIQYLKTRVLTDKDNVTLPQLALKLIPEKTNISFRRLGQPKLNGIRGKFGFKKLANPDDLFHTDLDTVYCKSRDNNDYVMTKIANLFLKFYKDNPEFQHIKFDGEFYIHGMPLNIIKKHIPIINAQGTVSKPELNPDDMEFIIFDIDNGDIQLKRLTEVNNLKWNEYFSKLEVRRSISFIEPATLIHNLEEATKFRDNCIERGYEGCILRDFNSLYQYGKKTSAMYKYKSSLDTECTILKIIDEGLKNNMHVIKVICKNDINDETFEVTPGSITQKWTNSDKMKFVLDNPIGKKATISFYERSGVKKVPFHANLITVRDYE